MTFKTFGPLYWAKNQNIINTITVKADQVFTIFNSGKPAMQGGYP